MNRGKKKKETESGLGTHYSKPFDHLLRPAWIILWAYSETVTQGGTRGIGHPMWRKTQGAGIVKGWEDKQDCGHIPDTFM